MTAAAATTPTPKQSWRPLLWLGALFGGYALWTMAPRSSATWGRGRSWPGSPGARETDRTIEGLAIVDKGERM